MIHMKCHHVFFIFIKEERNPTTTKSLTNCKNLYKFDKKMVYK